mmetsp:Transcript_56797/g.51095  ORF Transcript_56797/g.51095 Transcript_56797/m.51095 type:complete len:147 (-) Transcript_56797:215-655(-)
MAFFEELGKLIQKGAAEVVQEVIDENKGQKESYSCPTCGRSVFVWKAFSQFAGLSCWRCRGVSAKDEQILAGRNVNKMVNEVMPKHQSKLQKFAYKNPDLVESAKAQINDKMNEQSSNTYSSSNSTYYSSNSTYSGSSSPSYYSSY